MRFTFRHAVAWIAASTALAAVPALAQTWPTKTVRFINPFPAGGGVGVFALPIAAKLTTALEEQVMVENRSLTGR